MSYKNKILSTFESGIMIDILFQTYHDYERCNKKGKRKKAEPFQSAMSVINFYKNRGGKNISASQKKVLDHSKDELRKLFGSEEEK